MRYIFRLLRRYLKIRRSLFKGDLPHWIRDLLELIKYVNIIGLTITLAAITLAPDHFFYRLPQYISCKHSWFGSPVKFFTQGVALMAALSFVIGENLWRLLPQGDRAVDPNYTSSSVYWYVLLYALLAPVCVPFISIAVAPFAFLHALVNFVFSKAPFLKSALRDGLIAVEVMLIPASPSTYARMNWSRFFWSLCYYDVYFFLTAVIVLTPLTIFVALMINSILLHDYYTASKVLHLSFVGLLYSRPVFFLIVGPYIALLQSAVASPTRVMTRAMIVAEYNSFEVTLSQLAEIVRKEELGSVDEILGAFESLIATYERRELKRTALMSDEVRKVYLAERSKVLSKVLSTAQLKSLHATRAPKGNESFVRLLDRIDSISHPDVVFLGRLPQREVSGVTDAK